RWPDYVRAETDLRVGRHIIVAPDHALVQGQKIEPMAAIDPSEDPLGWGANGLAPAATATAVPTSSPIANRRPRRSRPADRNPPPAPPAPSGRGRAAARQHDPDLAQRQRQAPGGRPPERPLSLPQPARKKRHPLRRSVPSAVAALAGASRALTCACAAASC